MNWKTDAELFALVRRELFTCVVGDVMDKFHFQHQFLPPQPAILALLKLDAAIEQAAVIDVTVAQRDAEHPGRHQRAIRGDDGKRHG